MRSLELFSGAGGLAKGLEMSGFKHCGLVEFNRDACQTLRNNFDPSKVFEGDIQNFDFSTLDNIDVVTGGPPCQPFSLGGKHKACNDLRDMFPYAIKAINNLKPKAFVFENVKGLLRPSFSEYFEYIILRLKYPDFSDAQDIAWKAHLNLLRNLEQSQHEPWEYNVKYQLINAANHGIPQVRERVIIVGIRADVKKEWHFPKAEYNQDRLLWDQYVSGQYWEKHQIKTPLSYSHSASFVRKIERLKCKYSLSPPSEKPWLTMRDALGHLPDPRLNNTIEDHQFRDGARSYPGHTGSMFDLPSKTIKAGAHGVPGGENMIRFSDDTIRYLTVHEAKLIQGFPHDFKIHGAWGEAMRQIGNAVPAPLFEKIGRDIKMILSYKKDMVKAA